ncbi:hypothetical protein MNBD_GAMMA23-1822 [hydrothermal vent metagenome]|uniref:Nudix hydrolase domain-containing protein n=1 Tax=hydrothermal vent metagenome TaxID=652676 RepID=A0A3B0ZV08_9ZZZZ
MTVLESKTIFTGRIIKLSQEKVCLPDNTVDDLEIIYHPGGAAIVAVNYNHEVCLLRQYRHAMRDWVWEIPAGILEPNDGSPMERAQQELREESGCTAKRWVELGEMQTSPGIFTEKVHLFLATELSYGKQNLEQGEVIEVHWLDFRKALLQAQNGEINDAKTCIALFRSTKFID